MKKPILLLLIAFTGIIAQAQIPNGYYDNATGKTGDELKVALHNIIKGHQEVSYSGLLNAFAYTDCKSNGKIWDIYSNIEYSPSSSICGNYDEEGDCWNREHTWPQSWFNEESTPRTDLFHVYPTDGYVNGRRSSYPYGEVNKPTYTSGNGSKLGPCVTSGYSGTVFEPVDEYKGDIARSYFYMSVRYYSEDGNWTTSGMTNKSEIKSWAMTMLLRWSDNDPVSEKEIARNNAVYGYQGNRNPFIDHPEYARMIWDPNYTPTASYNITYASNLSNGSVSGPSSAAQGSTVAIVATPNAGYQVSGYSVYKTGDQSTTVSVSSNGTFTMPGYAVTVSATFAPNNTYYDIALASVSHGSIGASASSAKSGTTINLTATPASGYSLYSWYVYKTGDMSTTVSVTNNSFVMPAFNVTVTATFVQGSANGNYVKVTSAPSNGDWSGTYLIVYETSSKAFNGSLTTLDAVNNNISVTISSSAIASNTTTDAANFTIASMTGGYSIQAASGKYIGNAGNSNSLTSSDSPLANTISYTNGTLNIVSSGGAYLMYNNATDQNRFRYFKSGSYSNQQPIQLYKKTGGTTPTHTIHFNSNGGTGSMNDQTVNEMEANTLTANTFTREDFEFDGWNTQSDGQGQYYADQATVYLTDDITLYAQWNQKYSVTVVQAANGTIAANPTSAVEETAITLSAIPDSGYEFDHWIVTDASNNPVVVTENQFEMPASNVTVTATFVEQSINGFVKITSEPNDWSGEYILVYENSATEGYVWTGVDAASCYVSKTIVDGNTIENDDNLVTLTIASMSGGYSIKVNGGTNNGEFISGTSGSNTINYGTSEALNTLAYESNSVKITSNTSVMRYNSANDNKRFRYFKSSSYSSQQLVQLYKKVSGTTPDPGTPFATNYNLVTSIDQLVAGRTYLIVNTSNGKALSTNQRTNNREAVDVTIENDIIESIGTTVCELTLGGSSGQWTFKDGTKGYLYAPGGGNYLKTQETNTTNGQWSITISNNGVASIVSNATSITQKTIRYNPNNNNPNIFSCYESGQQDVCLFIRSEEIPITQNTTEANIFPFDKHTVASGTTLTVTGTATCNDPNNLIIEDGAQFIHHNDGVQATFKKGVEAFTNNETSDGWYTIATPFSTLDPASVLTTDSYDLYAYDEDGDKEWLNYKANSFNLTSGNGYLYAHNPTTTLRMTGTLNNGDYSQTVNLSYANAHENIRGYNLIGNPTAHDITFNKTAKVSDGYYYLSNSDNWVYINSNTVPAGRGFLVKANATGQSVELNPAAKGDVLPEKGQYLCITIDNEKVYVKMNEGVSMPLLSFHGHKSPLYLTRDQVEYVMLVKENAESINLNYKTSQRGSHTLDIRFDNAETDYLRLIDRLTGADIDLLSTPTYTFESKPTDYAARFVLRFTPNESTFDDDQFAYYKDGQFHLMVNADASNLQIIDAMGRVIHQNSNIASGVYVLRLITSDKIRTQKIVVR